RQTPDLTAVFACNDYLALGALFECQRRGIHVPQGIAIIGYNDLDVALYSVPTLTTVSTERRWMGTRAAQSVLDIMREGKKPSQTRVDVGFTLMLRASTASEPGSTRSDRAMTSSAL